MYFESRMEAGAKIAAELLDRYRYENCAVVALSDGGVLVGEQIASALHCVLTLLLVEDIQIPGESMSLGGVSEEGKFSYNGSISSGEAEEYSSEYHGYLEEQKREAFQRINRLLGDGGLMEHRMIRDHVVILVSDGLDAGATLDVALDFLKPIRMKKLIVVAPVASAQAVDKLHAVADELHILDVKENYLGTNHYYSDNTVPTHAQTIEKINKIVLNWR